MTVDEHREMLRNNYAAQMKMLGYQPDGNPRDLVEVIRCKDCKHAEILKWLENVIVCKKHNYTGVRPDEFFCADGERR